MNPNQGFINAVALSEAHRSIKLNETVEKEKELITILENLKLQKKLENLKFYQKNKKESKEKESTQHIT